MAFTLKYEAVRRLPNPMVKINPMKNGTGKIVNLQDRVDKLNKNAAWKKTKKNWVEAGKTVDISRIPKFILEELGLLNIAEDVQRELDEKHCANRIAPVEVFDPALMQPALCIKTSKGEYISINSQHTVSTIAGLIDAGLVPGVTDWRKFKFPFYYVETDSLAFARRAFGVFNGKGSKKQSQYMQLRNAVYIVRIDKETSDPDEVAKERRVSIAEKHECFPVELNSDFIKYPGTFTNISTFEGLTDDEIDMSCAWHNKYFHYEGIHVSLFFIYRDLVRKFKPAKCKVTPQLEEELAALIQNLFGSLSQFAESCKKVWRLYTDAKFGYEDDWNDDIYAEALLQLYKKFGGAEKIPKAILDTHDDLVEFFDDDILNLADNNVLSVSNN